MRFGLSLLGLDLRTAVETAILAEDLGFESVWLSDHVVVPVGHEGDDLPEHGPVPPDLPLYDVAAMMAHLGAVTRTIRMGTWVYVLPLRHPFVTARAFQTADVLSGGRVDLGVGVGYLRSEFDAVGVDYAARGRITDEALEACARLWTEGRPEFHGQHIDFPPVGFGPPPVQNGGPPVWVGGESKAAMRRAVRFGAGWIGVEHTPESLAPQLKRLRALEAEAERTEPVRVTTAAGAVTGRQDVATLDAAAVARFEDLGVERLIVRPWPSGRERVAALERFAEAHLH